MTPMLSHNDLLPNAGNGADLDNKRPLLVAATYLSHGVREAIEDAGASYVDQTGNVRVVCALARAKPPVGVRDLAAAADTDPGYVSRLLGALDREAIVDLTARGRVERVDWRKLLLRWSEEAPFESRTSASTWLAARGLKRLWESLRDTDIPYLVTGSAVAAGIAPVAPTRLASLYVEDAEGAAAVLGLRAAHAGANVVLLQPQDDALFASAENRDGLRTAGLPLVVADLLSGPGRSPAEAEALMEWMAANEETWRG